MRCAGLEVAVHFAALVRVVVLVERVSEARGEGALELPQNRGKAGSPHISFVNFLEEVVRNLFEGVRFVLHISIQNVVAKHVLLSNVLLN